METHLSGEELGKAAGVSITFKANPPVSNAALNVLFEASWPCHVQRDFQPVLKRSLAYICAYADERLIGFVNAAWDGGVHAFILDTTVHPEFRRHGIGVRLVQEATATARERGIHWLHVDYEPHLETFYRKCGFIPTAAGVMRLIE
jgi:GNAT superfamily N-acetyltransferase